MDEHVKNIGLTIGALVATVYVLGEIIKVLAFAKRRSKDRDELDQLKCRYHMEDHARVSEVFLMGRTNEFMVKELHNDQAELVSAIDRIAKRFDDVAQDLKSEVKILRMYFDSKNREQK